MLGDQDLLSVQKTSQRKFIALSIVILLISIALRIWPLPGTWLWSDEIFSVSLAEAGFWKALLGTLRHDLHPPVYYLQLVPWAAIFSSDAGLVLNSVFWDIARTVITMAVLYRMYGRNAALIGGLASAFLGAALYNSENLRMYAMMGFAVVASWALTERIFSPSRTVLWRDVGALFFMQILIVGSHGAGPLFVVYTMMHGAVLLWSERRSGWRPYYPWLAAQALIAMIGLGVMLNGVLRETTHYQIDWSWNGVLFPLGFISAGTTLPYSGAPGLFAATVVTVAIIALAMTHSMARRIALIYVVAPIIIALLVSATVKPIYGFRVFYTSAVFIPILLGILLGTPGGRTSQAGRAIAISCLLAVIGFGIHQRLEYRKEHDYPALAARLKADLQPGDLVVQIRQPATAWALGRYLIGPGWGDIMRVQHPDSDKWKQLFAKLGQQVRSLFAAETDRMRYGDTVIALGEPASNALIPDAKRVWVLSTFAYASDAVPEVLNAQKPDACWDFRGAYLCRYDQAQMKAD